MRSSEARSLTWKHRPDYGGQFEEVIRDPGSVRGAGPITPELVQAHRVARR
jgi:hypothetical protein